MKLKKFFIVTDLVLFICFIMLGVYLFLEERYVSAGMEVIIGAFYFCLANFNMQCYKIEKEREIALKSLTIQFPYFKGIVEK